MLGRISIALALACVAVAQNQPPKEQTPEANVPQNRIRVQVNEVIVPVTVTDDKNRFVSDLTVKDFKLFDDGREQKIKYFTRDRNQPVVVGFLLDMSNSTRLHWKIFQSAVQDLILALMPGDDKRFSGYLISYSNDAELVVDTTNDPEPLLEQVRKMKPGGGAALFDAIYMSCKMRHLVQGEPYQPRRILVIVGDGHDSASKKSLDQVLELAQRNQVTIFGVSTVSFGFSSDGAANLKRLCEETGGRVVYPLENLYSDVSGYLSKPSDAGNYVYTVGTGGYASELSSGIFRAVTDITGEVTTQYILRYVPDTPAADEKQFRDIRVAVDLPNVKVRYRKGYYPFAP